jgi:hypothetical protein
MFVSREEERVCSVSQFSSTSFFLLYPLAKASLNLLQLPFEAVLFSGEANYSKGSPRLTRAAQNKSSKMVTGRN